MEQGAASKNALGPPNPHGFWKSGAQNCVLGKRWHFIKGRSLFWFDLFRVFFAYHLYSHAAILTPPIQVIVSPNLLLPLYTSCGLFLPPPPFFLLRLSLLITRPLSPTSPPTFFFSCTPSHFPYIILSRDVAPRIITTLANKEKRPRPPPRSIHNNFLVKNKEKVLDQALFSSYPDHHRACNPIIMQERLFSTLRSVH